MGISCHHLVNTEQEVLLKMDKTRDIGILTVGWPYVVKTFELHEITIYMFEFTVENNGVCLVITPV